MLYFYVAFILISTFVTESSGERKKPWFTGPRARNHFIENYHKIPKTRYPTLDSIEGINHIFEMDHVYYNYDTMAILIEVIPKKYTPNVDTTSEEGVNNKRANINNEDISTYVNVDDDDDDDGGDDYDDFHDGNQTAKTKKSLLPSKTHWSMDDMIEFRQANQLPIADLFEKTGGGGGDSYRGTVKNDGRKRFAQVGKPLTTVYQGKNQHTTNISISTSQAFLLHSNIGSNKTIYLNFLGGVINDSYWIDDYNYYYGKSVTSVVYLPYDRDGNYSRFSQLELLDIISAWRVVASDYAPFDVDVTTEYPGLSRLDAYDSTPYTYGSVASVDGANTFWGPVCDESCTGIAMLSAYGLLDQQPAWYFPDLSDPSRFRISANTMSHELGHTFGLMHQSYRDPKTKVISEYYAGNVEPKPYNRSSWSPIMGGCYGDKIYCTWSRGDYYGGFAYTGQYSKTVNPTQDDMALISRVLLYARDDFPNATQYLRLASSKTTLVSGTSSSYDYIRNSTSLRSSVEVRGCLHNYNDTDSFVVWLGSGIVNARVSVPTTQTGYSIVRSTIYTNFTAGPTTIVFDGDSQSNLDASLFVYSIDAGVESLIGTSATVGYWNETLALNVTNKVLGGGYYRFQVSAAGVPGVVANYTLGYTAYGINGQYLLNLDFVTATKAEPV